MMCQFGMGIFGEVFKCGEGTRKGIEIDFFTAQLIALGIDKVAEVARGVNCHRTIAHGPN